MSFGQLCTKHDTTCYFPMLYKRYYQDMSKYWLHMSINHIFASINRVNILNMGQQRSHAYLKEVWLPFSRFLYAFEHVLLIIYISMPQFRSNFIF